MIVMRELLNMKERQAQQNMRNLATGEDDAK
jgi:hypothetical protein